MNRFREHLRSVQSHLESMICFPFPRVSKRRPDTNTEQGTVISPLPLVCEVESSSQPPEDTVVVAGNVPEHEATRETDSECGPGNDTKSSKSPSELLLGLDTEHLRQKLQEARIEYPLRSHHFFVPESEKAAIITEEVVVREILAKRTEFGYNDVRLRAKMVVKKARNLFAILAYLGKGGEICDFLDERLWDKDLPFERAQGENRKCMFSLQRKNGQKIHVLDRWTSNDLEAFGEKQWYMLAPVFKDQEHYELHDNTVLPFISLDGEDGEQGNPTGGGYGEVFTYRIHKAHHKFHNHWKSSDQHLLIAIKRLRDHNKDEFDQERENLTTLGRKRNAGPHLVKLLATYEHQGKYHLIFPRANCNLRKFWSNRPHPAFDNRTAFWSLQQMAGIAKTLNIIHNFKVTRLLDVDNKVRSPQKDVKLKVQAGEEIYGRHGDIKPENILWFEQIPEHDSDGQGILQITDFGLGRFHGRDSRTEQFPHNVFGSPTYEPPECKLHRPVSRAYDLWSLGCLYLEFVTWLLMGYAAIEKFSDNRGEPSSLSNLNDDHFFTVIRDGNVPVDAFVREGVINWAKGIHEHPNCSKFIHDVVDLVMNDLLCIEAKDRVPASELCVRFRNFLAEVDKDESYLCAPATYQPSKPIRLHSEAELANDEATSEFSKSRKAGKKVAFVGANIPSSFSDEAPKNGPQDPVGQNPRTPNPSSTETSVHRLNSDQL